MSEAVEDAEDAPTTVDWADRIYFRELAEYRDRRETTSGLCLTRSSAPLGAVRRA